MKSKFLFLLMSLMVTFLFIFNGCEEESIFRPVVPEGEIRVINTSFNSPAMDINLDGTPSFTDVAYGDVTDYIETVAGYRRATILLADTVHSYVSRIPVLGNVRSTVYIVDSLATLAAVVGPDTAALGANVVKIRFVNSIADRSSPNSKKSLPIRVRLAAPVDTVLFSSSGSETMTNYSKIAAGTYTFVITTATSTPTVLATFTPLTVTNGTLYTVVARGTANTTDTVPLNIRVYIQSTSGESVVDLTTL